MGLKAAAFFWGLGEATMFFIVPDVLLSAVALRDRAMALRLCLWTLGGALSGGVVMYLWGQHDVEQAGNALAQVPAIGQSMLVRVGTDLERLGSLATFLGPLTGTPYKIYAALSPEAGIPLAAFMLISVPARLIRFLLVAAITSWIARTWLDRWSWHSRMSLLLGLWAAFYTVYFLAMPWR